MIYFVLLQFSFEKDLPILRYIRVSQNEDFNNNISIKSSTKEKEKLTSFTNIKVYVIQLLGNSKLLAWTFLINFLCFCSRNISKLCKPE